MAYASIACSFLDPGAECCREASLLTSEMTDSRRPTELVSMKPGEMFVASEHGFCHHGLLPLSL